MILKLINQLPKYEQRHALNGTLLAQAGNKNALQASLRSARTDKVKRIYTQIIQAV